MWKNHYTLLAISIAFLLISVISFFSKWSDDEYWKGTDVRKGADLYQHFAAGLFKISPEGGLDYLTDREKEMLRDLDWILGDHLLIPIVKAATIKSLWPAMENIGRDAAEVAFAKFTDITDSYNKSTYSKFLDNKEDYIQVLIHSLFGLTIEHLVRSGTVSQIPEPVPESFGVYIIFGKLF